jgi:hypothetical protein
VSLIGQPAAPLVVLWLVALPTLGQEAFAPPAEPPSIAAARASGPITIDGRLSERDWAEAEVATGFRQIDPKQGAPATFDTEVRLLYDADNLYVAARCHDPLGARGVRVRNLRRDFDFGTDDVFGVSFDTFRDGQNAQVFQVNPHAARRDEQVRDGDVEDLEWDPVWEVRTEIDGDGWTAEMAIPWATLRYPRSERPQWAINFIRVIRRLNETTGWSAWPRAYPPYRMSYAGLLTNLQPPPPATNLRVQPYAVLRHSSGAGPTDTQAEVGGDLKWALTPNTVLDATYNTDFAQADVDRQVVNLTRFSVLFPEQRQFFLENAPLFNAGLEREVRPFFSRRIGLDDFGNPIPIQGGLRLTHRTGDRSTGALLIRQDGTDTSGPTTFGVLRHVENVGRSSRVGGILVSRWDEAPPGGGTAVVNNVAAADAFLRLNPNLYVRAMLSGSATSGRGGDGVAASIDVSREGNWGIAWWVEEYIGPDYQASTGYLSRPDLIRSNPGLNLDLRPSWRPGFIRRFVFQGPANIYHRASDHSFQEAQWYVPLLGAYFENGAWFLSWAVPMWERLDSSFTPLPGLAIPPGNYQYTRYLISTSTDPSRHFSLRVDANAGGFYDGSSQSASVYAQANPDPRVSLQLSYTINALRDIGTSRADKTTHLVQPMLRLALNPRLQLTSLYQYNTAARLATWNARFAWEFRPQSYVYLVYNDRRPIASSDGTTSPLKDRQLILKLTYSKPL